MNIPAYTALLAAFLVILQVVLMLSVGLHRSKGKFVGHEGDRDLERKVRRHGNLAENSGLFLAVLVILEILVGQTTMVLTLCIIFAVARLLHAVGFASLAGSHGEDLTGARKGFAAARAMGAMGTLITAVGSAWALIGTQL
ncbi:MAPEG family protein [Altererythrobacter sp. ZODW24]|uniref:MAPEG family protein n=1 Tax=Altererythrobacter sp. ZODW24 TaxID=2185142 RepID=UPI000DF77EE7|nr:MAPEG family protein [Altererythrobacter sp. ZODW24]